MDAVTNLFELLFHIKVEIFLKVEILVYIFVPSYFGGHEYKKNPTSLLNLYLEKLLDI